MPTFVRLALVSLFVVLGAAPSMAAFHGPDEKLGKPVSRSAVDATGPAGSFQVGVMLQRIHGGRTTLTVSSLDEGFDKIDPKAVQLMADGKVLAIPFLEYVPESFAKDAPPHHRFWFGPLDEAAAGVLAKANALEVKVPQRDGAVAAYGVAADALADLQEVLTHAPIDPAEMQDPLFETRQELERYRKLVAGEPKNYLYRSSLGEALFLLGSTTEALETFAEVGKLTPHKPDEVVLFNRAVCLYKLKKI